MFIRLEWLNFITLKCLTAGSIYTRGSFECCVNLARPAVSFDISEKDVLLPPVPLLVMLVSPDSPLMVNGTLSDVIA